MSIRQYVRIQLISLGLRYQNESCSECHQDVTPSLGQYVYMSVCQYVRMQLFSLGIKMKVVHNVIRMSDSQKILVRKSLRTAKEPALVHISVSKLSTMLF